MKNGTNERPTISRVLFKFRMTIVLILLMMLRMENGTLDLILRRLQPEHWNQLLSMQLEKPRVMYLVCSKTERKFTLQSPMHGISTRW